MTDTMYKAATATLLSVLITGLTAWFAFGADTVRKDDLHKEVSIQVAVAVGEIRKREGSEIQLLSIEYAKLSTKLDFVIDELKDIKRKVNTNEP